MMLGSVSYQALCFAFLVHPGCIFAQKSQISESEQRAGALQNCHDHSTSTTGGGTTEGHLLNCPDNKIVPSSPWLGTTEGQGDAGQSGEVTTEKMNSEMGRTVEWEEYDYFFFLSRDRHQSILYNTAWVLSFLLPVIVVFGLVGNSLCMTVMWQPHNRRLSPCFYMGCLAVSDNLALLSAGHYWLRTQPFVPHMLSWECPLMTFVGQTCVTFGSVMIMCMTLERFIAVRFPLKAATWCSVKRAYITIATVLFISIGLCCPLFVFSRVTNEGGCDVYGNKKSSWLARTTHSLTQIAVSSLLPFVVLLTLNTLIILSLHERTKALNPGSSQTLSAQCKKTCVQNPTTEAPRPMELAQPQDIQMKKGQAKQRQLTVTLLLVSFTFLVLTLPQYAKYLYFIIEPDAGVEDFRAVLGAVNLVESVTTSLFFMNNACNILLYAVGGQKFRRDLAVIVCKCIKRRKKDNETVSDNGCHIISNQSRDKY